MGDASRILDFRLLVKIRFYTFSKPIFRAEFKNRGFVTNGHLLPIQIVNGTMGVTAASPPPAAAAHPLLERRGPHPRGCTMGSSSWGRSGVMKSFKHTLPTLYHRNAPELCMHTRSIGSLSTSSSLTHSSPYTCLRVRCSHHQNPPRPGHRDAATTPAAANRTAIVNNRDDHGHRPPGRRLRPAVRRLHHF